MRLIFYVFTKINISTPLIERTFLQNKVTILYYKGPFLQIHTCKQRQLTSCQCHHSQMTE